MSLFTKEEKKVIKEYYKYYPLIKNKNKLIEFIKKFVKIKQLETEKYGEVLTPFNLINQMLDKFDEVDKDIFKKDYTWFDPCAGMGNFHIMIYKRLIKYHKHDDIIGKMFYANEINKKNVFLYKLIFGQANINCGDSLKLSNDLKYDIIIGNPPYNSGTKNTGNTIYQEFISKFIKQYNKYFSFINPPCWRKPNIKSCTFYGLYDLMTKENHLCYLSIHDNKEGLKTFNAGTRYDWYIIDKNINNKQSIINGLDKKNYKINCNEWKFLPNGKFDEYKNIFNFNMDNNIKILYSRSAYGADKKHISKIKTNIFKYPVIHTTPTTGITYRYSNCNTNGFYGIKKVIFGIGGINPVKDSKGEYGMTQMSVGIEYKTDKEANDIIKAITSDKFKEFLKYNIWGGGFGFEYLMFNYFKKDFYKSFI